MIIFLSSWSASLWGLSKKQIVCFSRRRRRGAVLIEKFGRNFPRYVTMPKKRCSFFWFACSGMSMIAFIFLVSGAISLLEIVCPKNVHWRWLNWHLARFSFNPDPLIAYRTSFVLFSSRSGVSAQMIMSKCAFQHLSMNSMIEAMRAWHSSLALWIPYGMHRNLKRPQGELKVRSLELSSSTQVCQKTFEVSSLVKCCAPVISWNISVSVVRWCSLLIVLFRFRRSKQSQVAIGFFNRN